jgi:hypothetical protein
VQGWKRLRAYIEIICGSSYGRTDTVHCDASAASCGSCVLWVRRNPSGSAASCKQGTRCITLRVRDVGAPWQKDGERGGARSSCLGFGTVPLKDLEHAWEEEMTVQLQQGGAHGVDTDAGTVTLQVKLDPLQDDSIGAALSAQRVDDLTRLSLVWLCILHAWLAAHRSDVCFKVRTLRFKPALLAGNALETVHKTRLIVRSQTRPRRAPSRFGSSRRSLSQSQAGAAQCSSAESPPESQHPQTNGSASAAKHAQPQDTAPAVKKPLPKYGKVVSEMGVPGGVFSLGKRDLLRKAWHAVRRALPHGAYVAQQRAAFIDAPETDTQVWLSVSHEDEQVRYGICHDLMHAFVALSSTWRQAQDLKSTMRYRQQAVL